MDANAYLDEIKLKLTGGLLELELDDDLLMKVLNSSLREILRYYCSTKLVTVPFSKCIDMSKQVDANGEPFKINSIVRIYRPNGMTATSDGSATADPMAVAQWLILGGTGNLYNFQDYMNNYMAWNTLLQIRNTTSTDLAFRYDKNANKLYINNSTSYPSDITVEYVPRLDSVEEIDSDYWIDMLINLAVAQTKIIVGRIRSRYTSSGALWTQDGDSILQEGLSEYQQLQEYLRANTQLVYGID